MRRGPTPTLLLRAFALRNRSWLSCRPARHPGMAAGATHSRSRAAGACRTRPRAPRAYEAHSAQEPQLMGRRRFAETQQARKVAHAQFGTRERVEDPHAGRVAEHLERFGEGAGGHIVKQAVFKRRHLSLIQMN